MRGRCRFLLCPPCKVCPAKRPFFAARAMYKKKRSKLNSVKPDVELRPVTFLFVSVQSSLSPFSHFKKPPGISNPLPLLCVSSLHHPKSARSDANAQHPLPAKKTAESADTCHPPFGKCSFFPCRSDFVRIYYQTEALRNASSFPSGLPEELCGLSPPLVETLDRFYLPLGRASRICRSSRLSLTGSRQARKGTHVLFNCRIGPGWFVRRFARTRSDNASRFGRCRRVEHLSWNSDRCGGCDASATLLLWTRWQLHR